MTTWARWALTIGLFGLLINIVDWFVTGDVDLLTLALPLYLALYAAAELLGKRRRTLKRALRAGATAVLALGMLALAVPAAVHLARGEAFDWTGVLALVAIALGGILLTAAALMRLSGRRGD